MSSNIGFNNSDINTPTTDEKQFDNPADEVSYLRKKLRECQAEFQEFQESSRDLEAEYETQIQQLEKKNTVATQQLTRYEDENEQLKDKYNSYIATTQRKLNELQDQNKELTGHNGRLTSYIRELEQTNDDLERGQRTLAASLEDAEARLNQQIERNVLLEDEISEKGELECMVQRLKEEVKDLRDELMMTKSATDLNRRRQSSTVNTTASAQDSLERPNMVQNGVSVTHEPMVDSTTSPSTPSGLSRFYFASQTKDTAKTCPASAGDSADQTTDQKHTETDNKSQQTSAPPTPTMPAMVMPPSSRLSALSIVTDLLRKVGNLEAKLTTASKQ